MAPQVQKIDIPTHRSRAICAAKIVEARHELRFYMYDYCNYKVATGVVVRRLEGGIPFCRVETPSGVPIRYEQLPPQLREYIERSYYAALEDYRGSDLPVPVAEG